MTTKSIFVENSYHLVGMGNNGDTLELSEFRSLRKKLCSAGTRSLRRGCSLASSVIFEKKNNEVDSESAVENKK